MLKAHFLAVRLVLILGILLLASGSVRAQTNQTINLGANVGTFSYTVTSNLFDCTDVYTYTENDFTNFVYTSVDGVQHPFTDTTYTIHSTGAGNPCPSSVGPTITENGGAYTLVIAPHLTAQLNVTVTVPGYVNPKFAVLGVTYAPPGPQSFVQYTNSTLVSNTSSVSNSFASGYTVTVKIGTSGIFGWLGGTANTTSSTSWGQETDTSSSTTVSKQTQISLQVPGPADPYVGVDHDYDIIWVWLNPVELFTLTNNGAIQWNGYGYSTQDQNAMDVIGVYVGCLNGVFSQSSCNSQYETPFARSWAASPAQDWPSGQGPGLTSTDLQNILAADPYGQCTGPSPVGASACPSPDSTRFTLTFNQNIDYQQPPPGGQPFTTTFTESYTTASSSETSYTHTHSQTFGREEVFSTQGTKAIFGIGFDLSISITRTIQHTHKASTLFQTSNTSTATASITGPPCNVVNNACGPVYPPNPLDYGSAITFNVYQDNVFGGFLLIPATY
jgi:hypothetical protein